MQATPTKLRNGSWGARVQSTDVAEGDTVTVTTRAGKTWQATVERVLWTGDGVSVCATTSLDRSASASSRNGVFGRDYCGGPCPVSGRRCTYNDPCHDCL